VGEGQTEKESGLKETKAFVFLNKRTTPTAARSGVSNNQMNLSVPLKLNARSAMRFANARSKVRGGTRRSLPFWEEVRPRWQHHQPAAVVSSEKVNLLLKGHWPSSVVS
jgi:hypothetical protein